MASRCGFAEQCASCELGDEQRAGDRAGGLDGQTGVLMLWPIGEPEPARDGCNRVLVVRAMPRVARARIGGKPRRPCRCRPILNGYRPVPMSGVEVRGAGVHRARGRACRR